MGGPQVTGFGGVRYSGIPFALSISKAHRAIWQCTKTFSACLAPCNLDHAMAKQVLVNEVEGPGTAKSGMSCSCSMNSSRLFQQIVWIVWITTRLWYPMHCVYSKHDSFLALHIRSQEDSLLQLEVQSTASLQHWTSCLPSQLPAPLHQDPPAHRRMKSTLVSDKDTAPMQGRPEEDTLIAKQAGYERCSHWLPSCASTSYCVDPEHALGMQRITYLQHFNCKPPPLVSENMHVCPWQCLVTGAGLLAFLHPQQSTTAAYQATIEHWADHAPRSPPLCSSNAPIQGLQWSNNLLLSEIILATPESLLTASTAITASPSSSSRVTADASSSPADASHDQVCYALCQKVPRCKQSIATAILQRGHTHKSRFPQPS